MRALHCKSCAHARIALQTCVHACIDAQSMCTCAHCTANHVHMRALHCKSCVHARIPMQTCVHARIALQTMCTCAHCTANRVYMLAFLCKHVYMRALMRKP